MRLISTFILCCFLCAAQAQITAGPDPAPGNDCMPTLITLTYAGEVNGRSSYSYSDGQSTYNIHWTGSSWEFTLDVGIIFLLSSNDANTLEPPCSNVFPWNVGPGCDFAQAPYIGGPSCSSVPLAIELVEFKVQVKNQTVILSWATTLEKDNAKFIIERSAGDALQWRDIGFVAGGGTTSAVSSYTYTDDAPPAGLSFYRLRSVDFGGTADLSGMLSVYVKTGITAQLTPNPVQNILTVTLPNTPLSTSFLRIYDAVGQMVTEQPALETYMEVDMSTFTSGLYWVEIVSEQTSICRHVVIKT